jgi:hypothetical protein
VVAAVLAVCEPEALYLKEACGGRCKQGFRAASSCSRNWNWPQVPRAFHVPTSNLDARNILLSLASGRRRLLAGCVFRQQQRGLPVQAVGSDNSGAQQPTGSSLYGRYAAATSAPVSIQACSIVL